MSEKYSLEQKLINRLNEIRSQLKQNLQSKAISNIGFFISHLEATMAKNSKREVVYGRFFKGGKIEVCDAGKKMALKDWVKSIKFKNKQRIRFTVESVGEVGGGL